MKTPYNNWLNQPAGYGTGLAIPPRGRCLPKSLNGLRQYRVIARVGGNEQRLSVMRERSDVLFQATVRLSAHEMSRVRRKAQNAYPANARMCDHNVCFYNGDGSSFPESASIHSSIRHWSSCCYACFAFVCSVFCKTVRKTSARLRIPVRPNDLSQVLVRSAQHQKGSNKEVQRDGRIPCFHFGDP